MNFLYRWHRCQMLYRWEDLYSNWGLDLKQSSFDRAVRILHRLPLNIFRVSMLFTHALVPSAFRLQVSAMIQESPSKFFLTVSGILKPRHAAHGNKYPYRWSYLRRMLLCREVLILLAMLSDWIAINNSFSCRTRASRSKK